MVRKGRGGGSNGFLFQVRSEMKLDAHPTNKVLIVDDDAEVRHALRLLFEFEDFSVVGEASNGLEAVPLALSRQPDFVVLDYLMPRLNGQATAEVIRSLIPAVRIVAFSAILDRKPAWADAYLNKDRIAEVVPVLTALIGNGKVAEPT